MALHKFEIELDTPDDGYDVIVEKIWEFGEEGATLFSSNYRTFLSVCLDRSTLSEALLYSLHYLNDKSIPVKAVTAPKG